MSNTTARPEPSSAAAEAARRLSDALNCGGWLRPIIVEDAPLDLDEEPFADLHLHGWRYHAIDVPYEHRTVMFGGPFLFTATAIVSWTANRRRRRDAECLAAPQWRPLGLLRVVATDRRLLVRHGHSWFSVWLAAIVDVSASLDRDSLEIRFFDDPPYALVGPGATSLCSALRWLGSIGTAVSSP